MENNKNASRYISCACFGVCLLIILIDLILTFRYSSTPFISIYVFSNYVLPIIAFALVVAAIITSKQIILVFGGVAGALSSLISILPYLKDVHYVDYLQGRIFIQVIIMANWVVICLIGLIGKHHGKILGIIGGALVVISRISIIALNIMAYGVSSFSFQFYMYAIFAVAGIVLLGLTADSFPSAESAAFGASGQYGAGAPRQYRQYRRYDASAPDDPTRSASLKKEGE